MKDEADKEIENFERIPITSSSWFGHAIKAEDNPVRKALNIEVRRVKKSALRAHERKKLKIVYKKLI